MIKIRTPAVAGMFYTANPKVLSKEIDTMLNEAQVKDIGQQLHALIVPHAGLMYSGKTAAHAYKLLQNKNFDTVVIIAPSHHEYFSGISIFNGDAFRTPLGDVPINLELRTELTRGDKIIESSIRGHLPEHAIEVQLPFLQKVLNKFNIVPIIIGDQRKEFCFHLGEKLGKVLKGKNALIIASSDLSHYHNSDEANILDQIVIDDINKFDYKVLMEDIENERTEACGGGPIVSALIAAKTLGANHIEILDYCTSGDITGERDAVVGYLSVAVLRNN